MAIINGTSGNDTLNGTSGNDTLNGLGGNDELVGSAGNDFYDGGSGNSDTLNLRAAVTPVVVDFGAGTITGGFTGTFVNMERVLASNGNDHLIGTAGAQNLSGLAGNDTLEGGAGNDWLWGGGGNDTFIFRDTGSANADQMGDFTSGTDKIVLDATVMTALGAAGNFSAGDARFYAAAGATGGHDADDRVVYNTTTHQLFYDPDGSGSATAQLLATLQNSTALAATDIVVQGATSSNVINGTSGDDTLTGTPGDDSINGLDGNDSISGGAGFDTLMGDAGNDTLSGGTGVDSLTGGAGADQFILDQLGTSNADGINDFTTGTDKLVLDGSVMTEIGSSGPFAAGDERFFSGPGATTGHDATDRIIYDTTGQHLWYDPDGSGPAASQFIGAFSSPVNLSATDFIVINGTTPPGAINGTAGDDTLIGTAGNDTINGLGGNDSISGLDGDDSLSGGDGNDTLNGGNGTDTLDGGLGNDTYITGNGSIGADPDVVSDAGGVDTLIAFNAFVPMPSGIENLTLEGGPFDPGVDIFVSSGNGNELDNLIVNHRPGSTGLDGGAGNDTLIGSSTGTNWFEFSSGGTGNYGNDVVDGNGGGGILIAPGSSVTVNFQTGSMTGGGTGSVSFANIHTAQGTLAADLMIGDDSGVSLYGVDGDDTLTGGSGNDFLSGDGFITSDAPEFSIGNDSISGGAGNDTIRGGRGDDVLNGGAGNDTLTGHGEVDADANQFVFDHTGAADADHITDFRSGADKIDLDATAMTALGTTGNFAAGDARFFAAPGATAGHDADDRVVYDTSTGNLWYDADGNGAGAAQLIAMLDGAPTLAATDIVVENGTAPGTINGTNGNDSLVGTPGNDTINGLAGDDTLLGIDGNDVLNGGDGNDSLDGGTGSDGLFGGAGNDTLAATTATGESDTLDGGLGDDLYVIAGPGNIVMSDAGGIDTVDAVAMSWTLGSGFENLTLGTNPNGGIFDGIGNELNNVIDASPSERSGTLDGRAGNDVIFAAQISTQHIFGGDGNDTIHGENGGGWMSGGAGNDVLDTATSTRGWTFGFDVAPGAANSDVIVNFDPSVDVIELDGNAGYANTGPSGLFAAADGRFYAAAGASGGHDADDRVVYDTTSGNLWYDADGNGSGAAQLIATLQGAPAVSATNISIVNGSSGGTPGQVINGTSGNDTLTGTAGDDTLNGLGGNDELVGSAGNDFYDGGAGNSDTLNLRAAPTPVVVDFGAGTISGGFTGTFVNMERVLASTGNDHLIGTAGAQNLSALAGNDTLEGGAGNDWLWGGGGDDTFIFREAGSSNADNMGDFASGLDKLEFDNATLTALGADGAFASGDGRFYAAAGASGGHDTNDRLIYNTSTGQLYYDDDGSGAHAAQLVATLQGHPALAATDITVI